VPDSRAAALIGFEAGVDRIALEQWFAPVGHPGAILADTFGNGLRLASFTDCVLSPTTDLCVVVSDSIADGLAPSALNTDLAVPTDESSLWLANDAPAALWCSFAEVGWPQPARDRRLSAGSVDRCGISAVSVSWECGKQFGLTVELAALCSGLRRKAARSGAALAFPASGRTRLTLIAVRDVDQV
jgi:hypothetical protein